MAGVMGIGKDIQMAERGVGNEWRESTVGDGQRTAKTDRKADRKAEVSGRKRIGISGEKDCILSNNQV